MMLMRTTILGILALALLWTEVDGIAAPPDGTLGSIPPGGFQSPEGDPRFSAKAGVKPINNLVFQVLNVKSPGKAKHSFNNPREGWIYVRVPKSSASEDHLPAVLIDEKEVVLNPQGDT